MNKTNLFGWIAVALALVAIAVGIARSDDPVTWPPAPEIVSVSGSVAHGCTLQVYGSWFGEKDPPEPLRFDDFEDGEIGERLPVQDAGGWLTNGGRGYYPHYSQDMMRVAGETVIEQNYHPTEGHFNQAIGLDDIPFQRLYTSAWVYRDDFEGTAIHCANCKLWGNVATKDGCGKQWYGGNWPQVRVDCYPHRGNGHIYAQGCSGESIYTVCNEWFRDAFRYELGKWTRLERYIDIGTVGGLDFYSSASHDLDVFAETGVQSIPFITDPDKTPNFWRFGNYFDTAVQGASLRQYVGELYVDTTAARVEIGDAATLGACTHREIQRPNAWSDGAVGFEVNQGTMDGSVYLYVVNEHGGHSAGYPITFGDDPVVTGRMMVPVNELLDWIEENAEEVTTP